MPSGKGFFNMELIEKINTAVNTVVWGPAMLIFLVGVGVVISFRIKFFQIFGFKIWCKATFGSLFSKESRQAEKGKISPFGAMSAALAGAIGTGNIVGVATAITMGGAGAIFWMWVAAIFGMATIYAENVLGVMYREKRGDGYVGGPMYYIRNGLHSKVLAAIFAVMCVLASVGMGNMTQSNSVASALSVSFGLSPNIVGIVLTVLVFVIILGGVKRITQLTEKLLPFMAISFILAALVVIGLHVDRLPSVFSDIITSAFGANSVAGGFLGYGMSRAVKYGISRGVFSNEAGLGSSPIVHAAADTDSPQTQGMWGIFQVFMDTIVMCTLTALCILCTGADKTGLDGAALGAYAFESCFGSFGSYFVSLSVVLFGFATLITWSYFGEKSLEYLTHGRFIIPYRIIYALATYFGCIMNLRLVWEISDTLNALMAIPNLIALLFLAGLKCQGLQPFGNPSFGKRGKAIPK